MIKRKTGEPYIYLVDALGPGKIYSRLFFGDMGANLFNSWQCLVKQLKNQFGCEMQTH